MKTCSKCSETKPVTEFNKDASKRDGLQSYCRACDRAAAAKWRAANLEKAKAANSAWCASNKDKRKAAYAAWKSANPGKKQATDAAWQKANPEAVRINEQNRRARERAAGGRLSKGLAERLIKLQRGKCACGCKQQLGTSYHIDHVMPLVLGGTNTDDNIQLLTATCNLKKNAKHPIDFMQQRGFLL